MAEKHNGIENLSPEAVDIDSLSPEDLEQVSGGDCTRFTGNCEDFTGNCGTFESAPEEKQV